jgi:LacI family transcriptional regulator
VVQRRPTFKDISLRAGVSTFAVSQALSGKSGVAEATRLRVVQIAEELGYVPNALAAGLKNQATRTVGVMTASGRNQYYSMLVQAIDGVLQHAGYYAVTNDALRGGAYSAELEASSVDQLLQQRVSVVVATYSLSEASLAKLRRWETPVIFVDSLPPRSAADEPFIGADNYAASRLVAEHFASTGYQRTAFLAFPAKWNTRALREAGFVDTAHELGLEVEVIETENTVEGATAAVRERLSAPPGGWPQAIYATNTVLLQGTLRALHDLGLLVPADMGVLGFDDFDWAELVAPPITVVDQHIDQIGRLAADSIIEIVEGRRTRHEPLHIQVAPTLTVRASTAPPTR